MRVFVSICAVVVLACLCTTAEGFSFKRIRTGTNEGKLRIYTTIEDRDYSTIVDKACKAMKAKVEAGNAAETFVTQVIDFLIEYAESNQIDGTSPDVFKNNVGTIIKSVEQALADPYKFEPLHKAIREPFDFYQW